MGNGVWSLASRSVIARALPLRARAAHTLYRPRLKAAFRNGGSWHGSMAGMAPGVAGWQCVCVVGAGDLGGLLPPPRRQWPGEHGTLHVLYALTWPEIDNNFRLSWALGPWVPGYRVWVEPVVGQVSSFPLLAFALPSLPSLPPWRRGGGEAPTHLSWLILLLFIIFGRLCLACLHSPSTVSRHYLDLDRAGS